MVEHPPVNAGDTASVPGLGGTPGEGSGNLLEYSCLVDPVGKGAWWATVYGIVELDTI